MLSQPSRALSKQRNLQKLTAVAPPEVDGGWLRIQSMAEERSLAQAMRASSAWSRENPMSLSCCSSVGSTLGCAGGGAGGGGGAPVDPEEAALAACSELPDVDLLLDFEAAEVPAGGAFSRKKSASLVSISFSLL